MSHHGDVRDHLVVSGLFTFVNVDGAIEVHDITPPLVSSDNDILEFGGLFTINGVGVGG